VVHITAGLLELLLQRAEGTDPEQVNVVLSATPAGELEPRPDVDPDSPVLSHFYLPEAGASVAAVFGMDLGVPAGDGRGRFLSHPRGNLSLSETDDLAGVVLVAVPPWGRDDVAAFDRSGSRVELSVLDAEPPDEPPEWADQSSR